LAGFSSTPGPIEASGVRVGGKAEYLAGFSPTPGPIEPSGVRVGELAEHLAAFTPTLGLVGLPAVIGGLTATQASLRPGFPAARAIPPPGFNPIRDNANRRHLVAVLRQPHIVVFSRSLPATGPQRTLIRMPEWNGELIPRVCDEVIGGALDDNFPLYGADGNSHCATDKNLTLNDAVLANGVSEELPDRVVNPLVGLLDRAGGRRRRGGGDGLLRARPGQGSGSQGCGGSPAQPGRLSALRRCYRPVRTTESGGARHHHGQREDHQTAPWGADRGVDLPDRGRGLR
jgi:hypothetical protein